VDLFKQIVSGFTTPQITTPIPIVAAQPLQAADKLKGFMHIEQSADFSNEARARARTAMLVMLGIDEGSI
jgi:hypothetical protein